MWRTARVDPDVRARTRHPPGGARVVEMDVRHEDVPHVGRLCAVLRERRDEVRPRGLGPGLDEREVGARLDEIGRDRPAAEELEVESVDLQPAHIEVFVRLGVNVQVQPFFFEIRDFLSAETAMPAEGASGIVKKTGERIENSSGRTVFLPL